MVPVVGDSPSDQPLNEMSNPIAALQGTPAIVFKGIVSQRQKEVALLMLQDLEPVMCLIQRTNKSCFLYLHLFL